MASYIVTTLNWNDPSFWAAINQAGSGHQLDFSALPAGYWVDFDAATGRIILSDGAATYTVGDAGYGGASDVTLGGPTLLSFFTGLSGSQGNDTLTGSGSADTIFGNGGSDRITGGGGADSLDGGADDDLFVIEDGFGNDTISGGETGTDSDTIDLSAVTGGVTVDFYGNETGTVILGADTIDFDGIESFTLTDSADFYSAGADSVGTQAEGGGGSDTLWGGLGDDTYSGGSGGDEIYADAGNDLIYGNSGNDDLGGDAGNDTVWGETGDDYVEGAIGDDVLDGGSGADTLVGGADNDRLTGGADDDLLTGGTGNDVYVFAGSSGNDTITDFDIGDSDLDGVFNDQLDVSGMTDGAGGSVQIWDVTVVDDGSGNAKLLFPEGQSVVLLGVTPAQISTKVQKLAAGIPCFTAGTMILTARGEVAVERLRAGDLVQTRDNGLQRVVWSTLRKVSAAQMQNRRGFRPIRIAAGAFGQSRDLLLSPQHGMLLRSGGEERLVRAAHLARQGHAGVQQVRPPRGAVYVHLCFEDHQVVFANGLPSESYYPGPQAMASLSHPALRELIDIFPDLALAQTLDQVARSYGQAARPYARRRDLPLWAGELHVPP